MRAHTKIRFERKRKETGWVYITNKLAIEKKYSRLSFRKSTYFLK